MSRISSIILCLLLYANVSGKTYIVRPGVNQFSLMARTLTAGDSAVFEDGTYNETEMAVFANSGTSADPIVLMSRNRHKAVIIYAGADRQDIYITKEYIIIRDFDITQDKKGTKTSNNIIRIYPPASNISIIGNKLHNAYEEGVKTHMVSNILVEGNLIYDFTNEGIDFTPAFNSVIRNNELLDIGRCAIMIKYNNAQNVQVYNNYIHNRDVQMKNGGYAITLGGSSDAGSLPLQASYCAAWNNVIYSEKPGLILYAVGFLDSKNCGFFNNVIIGVKTAFMSGGKASLTENGMCMNNIIMDCEKAAGPGKGYFTDYNLYFRTGDPPDEPHGIYDKDPMFDKRPGSWRLLSGSPALKSGVKVDFKDAEGKTVDMSTDMEGKGRKNKWSMGVYQRPVKK